MLLIMCYRLIIIAMSRVFRISLTRSSDETVIMALLFYHTYSLMHRVNNISILFILVCYLVLLSLWSNSSDCVA